MSSADSPGLDDEPAADVDRRAGDLVTLADLDRDAFPRQQGLVDGRAALDDDTVGRDLLARAHDEAVADLKLVDRQRAARLPSGAENRRFLGAELGEGAQGGARAALRPRLEVAAGEQERDDDRGDLEVDLARSSRHATAGSSNGIFMPVSPASRKKSATTDQPQAASVPSEISVSIVAAAVAQVLPGGDVEGPAGPENDRGGELQRQPLPVGELERRDHPHQEHRQRQNGREDEASPQARRRILVAADCVLGFRQPRGVADLLDRLDERGRRHLRRVVLDGGLLGRVVDRGADAVELVQLALDPGRARGARHALDRQLDPLGCERGHTGPARRCLAGGHA